MTLHIVASLIDAARGIIYDRHMFIVQATGLRDEEKKVFENWFQNDNHVFVPIARPSAEPWDLGQYLGKDNEVQVESFAPIGRSNAEIHKWILHHKLTRWQDMKLFNWYFTKVRLG